eukprot:scaffold7506_cov286-Pinguiococcus_pyrenoidosus.AAC.2
MRGSQFWTMSGKTAAIAARAWAAATATWVTGSGKDSTLPTDARCSLSAEPALCPARVMRSCSAEMSFFSASFALPALFFRSVALYASSRWRIPPNADTRISSQPAQAASVLARARRTDVCSLLQSQETRTDNRDRVADEHLEEPLHASLLAHLAPTGDHEALQRLDPIRQQHGVDVQAQVLRHEGAQLAARHVAPRVQEVQEEAQHGVQLLRVQLRPGKRQALGNARSHVAPQVRAVCQPRAAQAGQRGGEARSLSRGHDILASLAPDLRQAGAQGHEVSLEGLGRRGKPRLCALQGLQELLSPR